MAKALIGVNGSVIASSRLSHFGELSQWILDTDYLLLG